jgi:hypothetical protein
VGVTSFQSVVEFRNRLVAYISFVMTHAGHGGPMSAAELAHVADERTWLTREYGRLIQVINRWGGMQMASHALGITSRDVVLDAINGIGDVYWSDAAKYAVQHLETVIGRLQAEADERRPDPEAIYRLTSPVFWLGRLIAVVRWILGTVRGRIVGGIGAVVLVVIGGIASGWAQAFFERLMSGPSAHP